MKKLIFLFVVAFLLVAPKVVHASEENVVINEVMPDPVGSDTLYEWIELYNPTAVAVDLNGWTLDGKVFSTSTIIGSRDYLIVAKNKDRLILQNPNLKNVTQLAINLTNSGKTIALTNGVYSQQVNYGATHEGKSYELNGPNATCNKLLENTTGFTLEKQNKLIDYSCWNPIAINSDNFEINDFDTKYLDVINNDYSAFAFDMSSFKITVQAGQGSVSVDSNYQIKYLPKTDFIGIDNFSYSICNINNQCGSANVTININAKVLTSKIEFSTDQQSWNENLTAFSDQPIYYKVTLSDLSVVQNLIVKNVDELLPNPFSMKTFNSTLNYYFQTNGKNYSGISSQLNIYPVVKLNEFFINTNSWFEIYNPTTVDLNLANYNFFVNDNQINSFTNINNYDCDLSNALAANSYCVIELPSNYNFSDGENITLEIKAGNLSIDKLVIQNIKHQDYGFIENKFFDNLEPTPGELNKQKSINLKILFSTDQKNWAETVSSDKAEELYFSFELDSSFEVTDFKWKLEDGTEILSPNIFTNYQNKVIKLELTFADNSKAEYQSGLINIKQPENIIISEVFPSPQTSKGEEEWIELFNSSDKPIYMKDFYLQDKTYKDKNQKYFLPEDYIQAQSYFVIRQSDFKFSLNNDGDEIYLTSPTGELMDSFIYTKSSTSKSISRDFSNNAIVYSTIPTPNDPNNLVVDTSLTPSNPKPTSTKSYSKTTVIQKQSNSGNVLAVSESKNPSNFYKQPSLEINSPTTNFAQPILKVYLWPIFILELILLFLIFNTARIRKKFQSFNLRIEQKLKSFLFNNSNLKLGLRELLSD